MRPVRANVELGGLLGIERVESSCVGNHDRIAGAHVLPVIGETLGVAEPGIPGTRAAGVILLETQEAAGQRLALFHATHLVVRDFVVVETQATDDPAYIIEGVGSLTEYAIAVEAGQINPRRYAAFRALCAEIG